MNTLPKTLEEMKKLPEAGLKDPQGVVLLTLAALCAYEGSREECYKMLDFLRGPRPLSNFDKQFIRDRFMDGAYYIPRSYFDGATPENDYKPSSFRVNMKESAYAEAGYKKYDLKSGGADAPRQVVLRNKPSTGEWFLWDQFLLAGIRQPKSKDAWA